MEAAPSLAMGWKAIHQHNAEVVWGMARFGEVLMYAAIWYNFAEVVDDVEVGA